MRVSVIKAREWLWEILLWDEWKWPARTGKILFLRDVKLTDVTQRTFVSWTIFSLGLFITHNNTKVL